MGVVKKKEKAKRAKKAGVTDDFVKNKPTPTDPPTPKQ